MPRPAGHTAAVHGDPQKNQFSVANFFFLSVMLAESPSYNLSVWSSGFFFCFYYYTFRYLVILHAAGFENVISLLLL